MIAQQLPVEVDKTSNNLFRSRPKFFPRLKASPTPIIVVARSILLQAFAACPELAGPHKTDFLPITSNKGNIRL